MSAPSIGLRRWLSFPRVVPLALGAALVVSLPTVGIGHFADDWMHLGILDGGEFPGTPYDLFRFADGDPDHTRRWRDVGPYPWWTHSGLKLMFWRPLSSAIAVAEHALLGAAALPKHLVSIGWYLALVAALAGLLRRFLPGTVGACALLLFALDDAHVLPVGWLANRNALISATFAFIGLRLHLEWRERGRGLALPLAVVALALGLLGGESAIGGCAYLLAYELVGARGPRIERARALVPVALLGVAYVVTYRALEYGTTGSGPYVDPVREPLAYLGALATRLPALLGSLLAGSPVDLWVLSAPSRPALVAAGVVAAVAFAVPLRQAFAALPDDERRHARWLLTGALLSLLPVAATFPASRLLLVPSVGGAVAVAIVVRGWWRQREEQTAPRSRALTLAGPLLLAAHVAVPLVSWPACALIVTHVSAGLQHVADTSEIDDRTAAIQRFAILTTPDPMSGLYPPIMRSAAGRPRPKAWWPLSLAPWDHELLRTGPATFELSLGDQRFLATESEQLFRGPNHPLAKGYSVDLAGLRVTVLEADARGPSRVRFDFDRPLEDPSLQFLAFRDGTLRKVTLPPVGGRLDLRLDSLPIGR